ncbi:MAG: Jag N-terminal domain-containing protein [Chloroflexi bacterium]|nr:Jag N-terminal domain-containing protein [Chloroflexota bacterium]
MPTRQFTAKTVDEATDLALETLELNREEVEIVVVSAGRSGILGFGGEPAEIHVTPVDEQIEEAPLAESLPVDGEQSSDPSGPGGQRRSRSGARRGRGRGRGRGRSREESESRDEGAPPADEVQSSDERVEAAQSVDDANETSPPDQATPVEAGKEESRPQRERRQREDRQPGPDPEVEKIAAEVLEYLLTSMDVTVSTFVSEEESTDSDVAFELEGEDSGLLIGRRGETLQSLQFLLNMIINKRLDRSCYVTIDVEGYRERRQENLAETADRAADRAVDTGQEQTLQPMTAADRRIVHMTLAEHPGVETESSGHGDQRRVVIRLKE